MDNNTPKPSKNRVKSKVAGVCEVAPSALAKDNSMRPVSMQRFKPITSAKSPTIKPKNMPAN